MTLDEVEREIAGIYRWFAHESPGTVVQETGHIANLWAIADRYYREETA